MNENINLCEILKDCPKGFKLYSLLHGEVSFMGIDEISDYPIMYDYPVRADVGICTSAFYLTRNGAYSCNYNDGDCLLFPSKDQRDWSKFTAPWYKKEKFDPKTVKPFDKVLCRNGLEIWRCDFFSFYMETYVCPNVCIGGSYMYCIPYNDDTKHLVGTTEEAPEYYRYWED